MRDHYDFGKMKETRAAAPLAALLGHRHPSVRVAAASALGSIGDPAALPELTTALSSRNAGVAGMAAWALGEIGSPESVDPAVRALTRDVAKAADLRPGNLRVHTGDPREGIRWSSGSTV